MNTYVTKKTEILVDCGTISLCIELEGGKIKKNPKIIPHANLATEKEIYISLDRLRKLPDSINEFLRIIDAELRDESYFVDGMNKK